MQRLRPSDDVRKRRASDLVALPTNQHAGLAIAQGPDGTDAQPCGQQAIKRAGRGASDDVPQRGGTQLEPCPLLISLEKSQDFGGVFFDAFGDHHDRMGFPALVRGVQPPRDLARLYLELGG